MAELVKMMIRKIPTDGAGPEFEMLPEGLDIKLEHCKKCACIDLVQLIHYIPNNSYFVRCKRCYIAAETASYVSGASEVANSPAMLILRAVKNWADGAKGLYSNAGIDKQRSWPALLKQSEFGAGPG